MWNSLMRTIYNPTVSYYKIFYNPDVYLCTHIFEWSYHWFCLHMTPFATNSFCVIDITVGCAMCNGFEGPSSSLPNWVSQGAPFPQCEKRLRAFCSRVLVTFWVVQIKLNSSWRSCIHLALFHNYFVTLSFILFQVKKSLLSTLK